MPRHACTKPVLAAVEDLDRVKGLQDSYVDMAELALRDVVARAASSPFGHDEFLMALKSQIGGIASFNPNLGGVLATSSRWYIIQTESIASTFFRDLSAELRELRATMCWSEPRDREALDPLNLLLYNLDKPAVATVRSRVEYHVVEYYRLVRNYLVHKTKLSRVEDARRRLLQDWKVELAVTFGGRPAPTVPAELSYDDYKVYTRAVTHLASVLNDACDLRPAEIAAHLLGESQLVQRIRQRLQSPRKARRLVEKTCVLRYATTSEFAAEAADTVLMAIGGDELARRTLP